MQDVRRVQELARLWADAEDERQAWVAGTFRRILQGEDPRHVLGLTDGRPGPSLRERAVKRSPQRPNPRAGRALLLRPSDHAGEGLGQRPQRLSQ
jgi:hypothetical protein